MELFVLMDLKVPCVRSVFPADSVVEAQRLLTRLVNGGHGDVAEFPEDFGLYHVGRIDDKSGEVSSVDHVSVGKAVDFRMNHNKLTPAVEKQDG